MGVHNVRKIKDIATRSAFISHLLSDIKALEIMLESGLIEDDITRIGAEQELCLVTDTWRPSKDGPKILKAIDDPHFTTEIARYNLEINLDPVELRADCFSKVENQLRTMLDKVIGASQKYDAKVLLTGILPTISKNELQLDYMTPNPRYTTLNAVIKKLRGADPELYIQGVDELSIMHDSVLFEGCNTSFQMHLQIDPNDFIASYNWAQAISGPILGISTNSPLLLGRELWSETRIALFKQSIDTRSSSYALKNRQARVAYGNFWASGSIVDIFKDSIANHEIILAADIENNSLEQLKKGTIPKLQALNLHNGTVYLWNRPCYGVGGGKAHVRIENRYIPAGPTVLDEMANFAFWTGLMMGRPSRFGDMPNCMDFQDAKANFMKSARSGKESMMLWEDRLLSVRKLVLKELLPIAYSGLEKMAIDKADIERFLGIIEKRTAGTTGSQWKIVNYRRLKKEMRQDNALVQLTKAIYTNQQANIPVHEWPIVSSGLETSKTAYLTGHIMSTQIFTVSEKDRADLATSVMQWKNIHHIPVENNMGELRGLLTWSHMEQYMGRKEGEDDSMVTDIMIDDVITVQPETEITVAIQLMDSYEIGCLPVVRGKKLVGIITKTDITEWLDDKGI